MARKRRAVPVAVVGAGMVKFGELFDQSYEDMVVGAYRDCLKSVDKGIDEREIEAAWLGTCYAGLIKNEALTGHGVAEPLAFFNKPVTRVTNACCTGSDAVRNAAFAVAAGAYDTVLVIGAEKMRDIPSRDSIVSQVGTVQYLWWHPRGDNAAALFGRLASAHMHEFGTKREHFARISVKSHHNGTLEPHAYLSFEVTLEQLLNTPIVAWPMGLLDS
ncbi:MAG: thiolase family protein, partial [Deltaproteobacteria bacterium]|nr:thiolase family protein [Deltaproteobacteria bacterium]